MENKRDHTIRSANDLLASRKQSDENSVNFVNPVKNCFGFRLRAYEAWRDLEKFFPGEENEPRKIGNLPCDELFALKGMLAGWLTSS
jgi:hypothetical protein